MRVETERRLKALEAELQVAEAAKKERTLAVRYHKVKFFGENIPPPFLGDRPDFVTERQKVIRKIKQAQNRLGQAERKSEKKKVNADIRELRVDLNYILVSFAFQFKRLYSCDFG